MIKLQWSNRFVITRSSEQFFLRSDTSKFQFKFDRSPLSTLRLVIGIWSLVFSKFDACILMLTLHLAIWFVSHLMYLSLSKQHRRVPIQFQSSSTFITAFDHWHLIIGIFLLLDACLFWCFCLLVFFWNLVLVFWCLPLLRPLIFIQPNISHQQIRGRLNWSIVNKNLVLVFRLEVTPF